MTAARQQRPTVLVLILAVQIKANIYWASIHDADGAGG